MKSEASLLKKIEAECPDLVQSRLTAVRARTNTKCCATCTHCQNRKCLVKTIQTSRQKKGETSVNFDFVPVRPCHVCDEYSPRV